MNSDQMQPEDTLDDRGVDDVLDEGYSPPERERKHRDEPDTLDERLSDEVPEVWDKDDEPATEDLDDHEVGDRRAGRLMAPDEGAGEDVDSEMYAEDEGIDGAGASAEEAAVHIIDDGS